MTRPSRADLAGVTLGEASPVAVMGGINVSPESFHAGSVYHGDEAVLKAALGMVEAGAALIDVGARSSAPYLPTDISEGEETERLVRAVGMLAAKLPVPVSADTSRPTVARAALQVGARVVNDVSALAEPALARVVAEHDAGLVVGASAARPATLRRRRAQVLRGRHHRARGSGRAAARLPGGDGGRGARRCRAHPHPRRRRDGGRGPCRRARAEGDAVTPVPFGWRDGLDILLV